MKKQIHVYCTGKVQGVGFRFTTEDIAQDLSITGWVKNLRNGGVEIMAEAEEETLKEFLTKISQYFSRYISNIDVEWRQACGKFSDFGIEF